jgi:hypothetical protein
MAIDIVSKLTSIKNLLEKNNTITSGDDISSGLTTRVRSFYTGVRGFAENKPIAKTQYPAICIELSSKLEILPDIGNNTKRDMEIYYDIVTIVDHVESPGTGREDSDEELIILAQNVEALLRGNITLSTTCDWCEIENTDYSETYREDSHNSVARISLKTYFYNQR